ncbi:MAG TPA: hypothetical protein VE398_24315 [Acidobacteriota bacterium]|nr:hypothetical protein [Acidobacteriota bacterium]
MRWLKASLVIQIILAAYFQAIIWFPLGSWNDQPGKRLIQIVGEGGALQALGFALALLLPVLLFAVAFVRRWLWMMWVALIGYGVWALMQIQSWWLPWIFGANVRALRNQEFLKRTYKIFPASFTNPAPDGMHFVLGLLLFSVVATMAVGLLRQRSR